MNIDTIHPVTSQAEIASRAESRNAPAEALIELREIKTILYLGLKGSIHLIKAEPHTIDTFA